jgi:hypothetical protein
MHPAIANVTSHFFDLRFKLSTISSLVVPLLRHAILFTSLKETASSLCCHCFPAKRDTMFLSTRTD